MPNSTGMSPDLLWIARVRCILMDLGMEIDADAIAADTFGMGPLERWMHEPNEALSGQTPLAALADDGGEDRIRALLASAISRAKDDPTDS